VTTELENPVPYAYLSDDGRYRYTLGRWWGGGLGIGAAVFVMLNPSTADAEVDDPTIRRCIGFAKALGCDGLHVVNLYAYRATKPGDMFAADDPVGPENDRVLTNAATFARREGRPLIAAWGANAKSDRVDRVLRLPGFEALTALGVTRHGAPRHPLYLRADARPQEWPNGHNDGSGRSYTGKAGTR
jgi:hypothetical protein